MPAVHSRHRGWAGRAQPERARQTVCPDRIARVGGHCARRAGDRPAEPVSPCHRLGDLLRRSTRAGLAGRAVRRMAAARSGRGARAVPRVRGTGRRPPAGPCGGSRPGGERDRVGAVSGSRPLHAGPGACTPAADPAFEPRRAACPQRHPAEQPFDFRRSLCAVLGRRDPLGDRPAQRQRDPARR